jgi:predicted SAM-dependent methyltransferase
MVPLTHRKSGYALVKGSGLEIGALHEPAELPGDVSVDYLDAMDERRASELFPEIPAEKFVRVDFIGDLDRDGLSQFPDSAFDFVVINHVLEHVANPVKAVRELFRICRRGGTVIIAIPDKDYTFDKGRALTPWEHLWNDYTSDVRVSDDEHYLDFLRSAGAHVFLEPPENLPGHIERARGRREHAHVWNSETFERFLYDSFKALGIDAELRYKSVAKDNLIEYFSAWQKR